MGVPWKDEVGGDVIGQHDEATRHEAELASRETAQRLAEMRQTDRGSLSGSDSIGATSAEQALPEETLLPDVAVRYSMDGIDTPSPQGANQIHDAEGVRSLSDQMGPVVFKDSSQGETETKPATTELERFIADLRAEEETRQQRIADFFASLEADEAERRQKLEDFLTKLKEPSIPTGKNLENISISNPESKSEIPFKPTWPTKP